MFPRLPCGAVVLAADASLECGASSFYWVAFCLHEHNEVEEEATVVD